jgi:hypothetical protein
VGRLVAHERAARTAGRRTNRGEQVLARKRPRLRPIWDSVVVKVTHTRDRQWKPVREALRADNCALHNRLLQLRDQAALSPAVSALRVLDVIAWREGKDRGLRQLDDFDGPEN